MSMVAVVKTPKKLIEVALPLDAINEAAASEKSIRHGHPSTLHLWWARRPLAAARAVIFGQMVNDPSWKWEFEHPAEIPPNNIKASWAASRNRLFAVIRDLVKWENTTNEGVLQRARLEIRKSWRETCELNKDHPQASELFDPDTLPAFHDPFAGGGALPLEAQRLGLESYASDINPVAVLINKAMIEIPPRFAGRPPVNPEARISNDAWSRQWEGAQGLSDDVLYYARWIREEAQKRLRHLYPPIEITADMARERSDLKPLVGQKLTVIAWIWARTVKSPNPAFRHVDVPLTSTFVLSSKIGKGAYVFPVISGDSYQFAMRVGTPPSDAEHGTKLNRANFRCLLSGSPIDGKFIKEEAKRGRMGSRLMAIVAKAPTGRVFLSPNTLHEGILTKAESRWSPDLQISGTTQYVGVKPYGIENFSGLFNARQLAALTTFSDLAEEVREQIDADADKSASSQGEQGSDAYASAVQLYLSLAVSKMTMFLASQSRWRSGESKSAPAFGRQAIAMVWDYADVNPFAGAGGDFVGVADGISRALSQFACKRQGHALQEDAATQTTSSGKVVSTDPPYYDNVPYADLSDYFYVWLRRSLKHMFPDLLATLATPKSAELVAFSYRHESKAVAEAFFLNGMTQAMIRIAEQANPAFPVSIYYAFKQSETEDSASTVSTGWDTFLSSVLAAGFTVQGTWPMRTEGETRLRGQSANALASSIVLVCRKRSAAAETITRRALIRELNQVLPAALDDMTRGSGDDRSPVAPVDLSQAIIGPGMAVFSKYAAVLEADGTPMSVRTALQLINRFLAEDDFDRDTQFCLHWFEQYGWKEGRFGEADTLARAKGTSVDGVKESGVLFAAGGIVRMLKWAEYPSDWTPASDERLPIWEALHHLIRIFKADGESGAGNVLAAIAAKAEPTRQLAYRLYTLCERAGWADDARAYNEIITSWTAIESAAAAAATTAHQSDLFG